jgi:ABC-type sugar transport system ATPase subunit
MWEAKLVIMDEPTAALGVSQTAMVLDLIKRLSSRGIAVLVISHNLNDVFSVADQIAVLHLGRMAAQGPAGDFDTQSAVELITTGSRSAPNGHPQGGWTPISMDAAGPAGGADAHGEER